jgi:hypothetical protein
MGEALAQNSLTRAHRIPYLLPTVREAVEAFVAK